MPSRSVEVAILVITSLVIGPSPRPAYSQERTRVRYGVTASVAHLPVVVANEAGLFRKYGFDVEIIHIRGGALITMTIMSGSVQFSGAGAESVVAAIVGGRVMVSTLTFHNAFPLMQMGWPILADLSKGDFIYPASCVASSQALVKSSPDLVERFLRAYLEAIRVIKKDSGFAERTFKKWQRESDSLVIKKTLEVYGPLFKPVPNVPDKGLELVLKELSRRRPLSKEFLDLDQFRDPAPLEKLMRAGWIDQLYK
jgi:ABC-type nitrate/sulfonate/bicarbonate transport system substrate-binding protein